MKLTQPMNAEYDPKTKNMTLISSTGEKVDIDVHDEGVFFGWLLAVLNEASGDDRAQVAMVADSFDVAWLSGPGGDYLDLTFSMQVGGPAKLALMVPVRERKGAELDQARSAFEVLRSLATNRPVAKQ